MLRCYCDAFAYISSEMDVYQPECHAAPEGTCRLVPLSCLTARTIQAVAHPCEQAFFTHSGKIAARHPDVG